MLTVIKTFQSSPDNLLKSKSENFSCTFALVSSTLLLTYSKNSSTLTPASINSFLTASEIKPAASATSPLERTPYS
nr:MAG TPA: hypothetical protein [Caudoviricetes sp.]